MVLNAVLSSSTRILGTPLGDRRVETFFLDKDGEVSASEDFSADIFIDHFYVR